jgi:ArsR family transcriptional regulator
MHKGLDMRELTKLLGVLSDESRLRALNLIQERECCVCEVMQVLGISQSKASRMLSALYDVGILRLRREGRWAYYSVATEGMPAYVDGVLGGIGQFLHADPTAAEDIKRLRQTRRAGADCADADSKCPVALAEG